jgi:hypothetical protein
MTTAHLENSAADSLPDESLPSTKTACLHKIGLQKELVVPPKAHGQERTTNCGITGEYGSTAQSKNETQLSYPTAESSQIELSPEIVVARCKGKRPRRVLSKEEAALLASNQTDRTHNGVLSIEQTTA